MESRNSSTDLKDSLVENAETALRTGRELLLWWKAREAAGDLRKVDLPSHTPGLEMRRFYDRLEIGGKPVSVMGCLQGARFQRPDSSSEAGPVFDTFLKRCFLEQCRWTHADGLPGGFSYTPLVSRLPGGETRGAESRPMTDLREIGSTYEWVVYRVDINDFVRSFPGLSRWAGTFSKIIREAAYVVCHPDYSLPVTTLEDEPVAESAFGYSFLPCLVEPNFFGFGPGRFGTAIKQFRFILWPRGQLEIQTSFLVAPRSERVLYFWGFDPVYSLIHLVDAVTFGRFDIRKRAHDRLDAFMLAHHGRVHHALLQGMHTTWEVSDWQEMAGVERRASEPGEE